MADWWVALQAAQHCRRGVCVLHVPTLLLLARTSEGVLSKDPPSSSADIRILCSGQYLDNVKTLRGALWTVIDMSLLWDAVRCFTVIHRHLPRCTVALLAALADYRKLMVSSEGLEVITLHLFVRPPHAGKAAGKRGCTCAAHSQSHPCAMSAAACFFRGNVSRRSCSADASTLLRKNSSCCIYHHHPHAHPACAHRQGRRRCNEATKEWLCVRDLLAPVDGNELSPRQPHAPRGRGAAAVSCHGCRSVAIAPCRRGHGRSEQPSYACMCTHTRARKFLE
jgi:hypothetical protein